MTSDRLPIGYMLAGVLLAGVGMTVYSHPVVAVACAGLAVLCAMVEGYLTVERQMRDDLRVIEARGRGMDELFTHLDHYLPDGDVEGRQRIASLRAALDQTEARHAAILRRLERPWYHPLRWKYMGEAS